MLLSLSSIAGLAIAGPPASAIGADTEIVSTVPVSSPEVLIQAQPGQRFTVVVDGQPHRVVGGETTLVLSELTVGSHAVEIRSGDNLVIWSHGTLQLIGGDAVVLSLAEGRMLEVQGRDGVWSHTTNQHPLPRKMPIPVETSGK